MGERPKYRHGRIIWARLRSTKTGDVREHPAIILNANDKIIQPESFDPRKHPTMENQIFVIGVSTRYRVSPQYVQLPFTTSEHPITKLKSDCAATIGWYHVLSIPDDVIHLGGDVPEDGMRELNDTVYADCVEHLTTKTADLDVLRELLGVLPARRQF